MTSNAMGESKDFEDNLTNHAVVNQEAVIFDGYQGFLSVEAKKSSKSGICRRILKFKNPKVSLKIMESNRLFYTICRTSWGVSLLYIRT